MRSPMRAKPGRRIASQSGVLCVDLAGNGNCDRDRPSRDTRRRDVVVGPRALHEVERCAIRAAPRAVDARIAQRRWRRRAAGTRRAGSPPGGVRRARTAATARHGGKNRISGLTRSRVTESECRDEHTNAGVWFATPSRKRTAPRSGRSRTRLRTTRCSSLRCGAATTRATVPPQSTTSRSASDRASNATSTTDAAPSTTCICCTKGYHPPSTRPRRAPAETDCMPSAISHG